jgi:hypothetical protein
VVPLLLEHVARGLASQIVARGHQPAYGGGYVSEDTPILLFYDDTFWRGARDGFAVTSDRLLWHNDSGQTAGNCRLSSIRLARCEGGIFSMTLWVDGNGISVHFLSEPATCAIARLLIYLGTVHRWLDECAAADGLVEVL